MWTKFEYTPYWDRANTEVQYYPFLEIELARNENKLSTSGLVDSGAYMTLANAEIAKTLGIVEEDCLTKPVGGIVGDNVNGFICDTDITVVRIGQTVTIPVLFVHGLRVQILLGHTGFFDSFRVKFQRDTNTFEISRSPSTVYSKK